MCPDGVLLVKFNTNSKQSLSHVELNSVVYVPT